MAGNVGRPRWKKGPKKGKFMSNRAIAAQKRARQVTKPTQKKTKPKTGGKGSNVAKKKGKKKGGKRKSNGRGGIPMSEVKGLMVGGAIYGFITEPDADDSELRTSVVSTLAKLPNIGNRDITNGIAFYLIDKHVWSNKYLRDTARAALVSGAVRFGRRGFTLGGDSHDELAGGWDEAADVTEQGEEISGVVG